MTRRQAFSILADLALGNAGESHSQKLTVVTALHVAARSFGLDEEERQFGETLKVMRKCERAQRCLEIFVSDIREQTAQEENV